MAGEEGTRIEGEDSGSTMSPEVYQQKVESAARLKGWAPISEWTGPTEDWVDAKEFMGRQKLYDRIHNLDKQLARQAQRFEEEMNQISKHFANVQQTEYDRALADLQAKLEVAVDDQDKDEVKRLNKEIAKTEVAKDKAQQDAASKKAVPQAEMTAEFVDWKDANPWFESDKTLQQEAVSIGIGYAATNPNKTQKDMLDYVTGKIKKLYPEKFGETFKKEKPAMESKESKVESGGGRNGDVIESTHKGRKLSVADLSDVEKSVMKTLIKRGALKEQAVKEKVSEQELYLRQLAQAKGL